ncbi:hypothetical protein GGI21_000240 [Coemansia aciculifera]|nr:hypothetical protein GGI21_000240 [Coemansia aciculifera]
MQAIGPGAAVRSIVINAFRGEIIPALLSFQNTPCIKMLLLRGIPLGVWDIFTLVKSLPLLSDLHTVVSSLGRLRRDLEAANLPDYVLSNYAPVGKRFRCWHFFYGSDIDIAELATLVLLLALACPNFDYAYARGFDGSLFTKALEAAIASAEFKEHAPRLNRLLQNQQ